MKEEELLAVLRLQKTPAVGSILAKKLIKTVGNAAQIFCEKSLSLQKIQGVGTYIIENLKDKEHLKFAEKEIDYILKNKINYSYFLDEGYPENLKHCSDGPILFFSEGKIDLNNPKIVSVVGTRNMTIYGKDFCQQIIQELQPYNPIIVSGFAYGVDICAHKAAVENDLQTIAVLAHGLEEVYPKAHKKYIHQIHENGGFITEFFHDEKPMRENFLKRNRIVAGLSKSTIIIESAIKGGSLVTADIANSYNRDVFALPGRVNDTMSKGCNNLISRNKAHILQSAEDVIRMLNWDVETKKPQLIQKELFVSLNDQEQKIYNYLKGNEKQLLDVIALQTQIPVYQLATVLLQMELRGIVRPLPGKLFELH